jgi:hypothetical protein
MALALSFSATLPMMASPLAIHAPVNAFFGKVKTIKFNVRNDSNATIKLMAGTTPLTVEPGKTVEAKVNEGDKLTYAEATSTRAAGDLVATATSQLSGNTVAIR